MAMLYDVAHHLANNIFIVSFEGNAVIMLILSLHACRFLGQLMSVLGQPRICTLAKMDIPP